MPQSDFDLSLDNLPLQSASESTLRALCKVLWGWKDCERCHNRGTCFRQVCPWHRYQTLDPYFEFFRTITAWTIPENPCGDHHALESHQDLLDIIRLLKERPNDTRADLTKHHFAKYSDEQLDPRDKNRAFDLAIRAITMVYCLVDRSPSVSWSCAYSPSEWHSSQSVQEFLVSTFPRRDSLDFNHDDTVPIRDRLAAKNLKKLGAFKFEATDNLKDHLLLNCDTRVIQVYHHTPVLKEHLMVTKERNSAFEDIIPRQLALETLDSLQRILFPLEEQSRKLLELMIEKNHFTPDCINVDDMSYRREDEQEIAYHYWGARLLIINRELDKPRPKQLWTQWLEIRSHGRYIMLVMLVGTVFATLLATGSLSVGIVQAVSDRHVISSER